VGSGGIDCPRIGCVPSTLLDWVKQVEIDNGQRPEFTTFDAQRIKELEREVKELRRANNTFKAASAFPPDAAGPPFKKPKRFIDRHHQTFGVEPICKVQQMALSCYRRHAARLRHSELRCARVQRMTTSWPTSSASDTPTGRSTALNEVWLQMNREGIRVVRCKVERLMKRLDLQGAR